MCGCRNNVLCVHGVYMFVHDVYGCTYTYAAILLPMGWMALG